jgi:hypothetical protein
MLFPALDIKNPQAMSLETQPVLHLPYPVRTYVARGIAVAVQHMGLHGAHLTFLIVELM